MDPNERRLQQFTELSQFRLHPPSIRLLPLAYCQRHTVVVLGEVDQAAEDEVEIGMLDVDNVALMRSLQELWRRPIRGIVLNHYEISQALEVGFGLDQNPSQKRRANMRLVLDGRVVPPMADSVTLTEDVLRQALQLQATDIHIETYRNDVDVRLRIDGVLHQLQTAISPLSVSGVINRLKVMSGLDITERREPQDGRFRVNVVDPGDASSSWDCDFRLSVVPGPHGEDAVIRVLGGRVGILPLKDLGMTSAMQQSLLDLLSNPEGLVLVTGPTGSGKTTTLYSSLAHLNTGKRKILTVEDPIEYELPKINQKQISHQLSMAALAKAFLRQDPDIMLIGEIRDKDTSEVAIRAASTGHLVLSTLHTSDSLGTISRLKGMGLGSDRLAEALLGVVAQRLLRRICENCRVVSEPTQAHRHRLQPWLEGVTAYAGAGCDACHNTGYRGRIGIYELLVVDTDLQDEIAEDTHIHDIREQLRAKGFLTMVEDAMQKVADGVTTLDEVIRVLPYRYLQNVS